MKESIQSMETVTESIEIPQNLAPEEEKPTQKTKHSWWHTIAATGYLVFKLFTKYKVYFLLKTLFTTGGSMLLSMWYQAYLYGWTLAVGMVLMIFVHECGHAFAASRLHLPFSKMVFLPGMGAFVSHKGQLKNAREAAYLGIMGPVFGLAYGVGCLGMYLFSHQDFWLVLAHWTFLINLFNLIPSVPLDGGWIVEVLNPRLLLVGLVLMVAVFYRNPMVWFLGLLGLPRVLAGWNHKTRTDYYQVTVQVRWGYGLSYLVLVALLAGGWQWIGQQGNLFSK